MHEILSLLSFSYRLFNDKNWTMSLNYKTLNQNFLFTAIIDVLKRRFNQELALKKLRDKRLLFVGDSLQRGQWQSLVCMVESIIPEDKKSMKRGRSHSVFKAKV